MYKSAAVVALVGSLLASVQTNAFAAGNSGKQVTAKPAAVSTSTANSAEVSRMAAELEARYVNTKVVRGASTTVVTFQDRTTGKSYRFEMATPAVKAGTVSPFYKATWSGWDLNRAETLKLYYDGSSYAIVYAIGAAVGCVACALGAAIEQNWSNRALQAYNAGQCIHINYWLTTKNYSGGYCK